MSINIKEIFQSDNLSISQDKINYNFDQILANGGGPQGLKGDKGNAGALGTIGPKGDVGPKGDTGAKGTTGADGYWSLETYDTPIDQHTLIPKIQPTSGSTVGEKPTNLVLGRDDTSYTEDAIDKNALVSLTDENGGLSWTDIIRIRLKSGVGAFNATSGVVRLIPASGGARLKIATIGGNNFLELQSSNIQLRDSGNNLKLNITSSFSEAFGTWNFLNNVTIDALGSLVNNGTTSLLNNNTIGAVGKFNNIIGGTNLYGDFVKINPTGSGAFANKLLVSQDGVGTVAWKNPYEVPGIYPINSIVFVNPADITESNFALTSTSFTPTAGNTAYSWYGRGKSTSRWAGWYLLFGQTNAWKASISGPPLYVPTNIPGSILMGASAPDNKFPSGTPNYRSSMATKLYNPKIGYGAAYTPSLRGTFEGLGSTNAIFENPGDLATELGGTTPSNDGSTLYDVLETGITNVALINSVPSGQYAQDDSESPVLHPLPMAVYLGTSTLAYNFYVVPEMGSSPVPGGEFSLSQPYTVSGLQTVTSNGSQQTVTGTITVNSQPVTVSFQAFAEASMLTGLTATSSASMTLTGGTASGSNVSVTRTSGTFNAPVTRTLTSNSIYSYTLTTTLTSEDGSATASFTVASAG